MPDRAFFIPAMKERSQPAPCRRDDKELRRVPQLSRSQRGERGRDECCSVFAAARRRKNRKGRRSRCCRSMEGRLRRRRPWMSVRLRIVAVELTQRKAAADVVNAPQKPHAPFTQCRHLTPESGLLSAKSHIIGSACRRMSFAFAFIFGLPTHKASYCRSCRSVDSKRPNMLPQRPHRPTGPRPPSARRRVSSA